MRLKRFVKSTIATLLSSVMVMNMVGCAETIEAADLMEGIEREDISGKAVDDKFIEAQLNFNVELFKNSVAISEEKNVLVSPLSVMIALSMTANGAVGDTKEEMSDVLVDGMDINELNEYLYTYINNLPSEDKSKLKLANSIWVNDRLNVENDFLQKNANYYGASIYKTVFDDQAIEDINNWVKENTDDMIKKIMEQHTDDAVMYLINAITFDSEWNTKYTSLDMYNGNFTSYGGNKKTVEMMKSIEHTYLEDKDTVGFIKPYKNNAYSFVGLLPNEEVDILDYVKEFTYNKYMNLMNNSQSCEVDVTLPKFNYEYEVSMKELLIDMGMEKSFDATEADFSKLGYSPNGNVFIGNVIHKTFISVDENGTKAGAVTKVDMVDEAAMIIEKKVKLDRPFIYMIIDNATNLPIFMGVAMDI